MSSRWKLSLLLSRRIAAELYAEIIKIKPEWHSDDLDKGVIKVVMTSSSSDGPEIAKHHTTKTQSYPPDMQKLATETVLKQAELIANEMIVEA